MKDRQSNHRVLFVSDPTSSSKEPILTSYLASVIKKTCDERKRWLHAVNSSSKNLIEDIQSPQGPRKTLRIRLFNMRSLRFGFVGADFEVDRHEQSKEGKEPGDHNLTEFRYPKIVFPARLAIRMGLNNDMVIELYEPWTKIFCERSKCDYVLNPFWIQIIRGESSDVLWTGKKPSGNFKQLDSSCTGEEELEDPFLSVENQESFEVLYECAEK